MTSKKAPKGEPKVEPKPEPKHEEEHRPPSEEGAPEGEKPQTSKKGGDFLPVRSYLDQTVVPLLIQALSELAKERYSFVVEIFPI